MKKLYSYNEGTHLLHITDLCQHTIGTNCIQFDTENEAVKYAGRSLGMCKDCIDKRDELLKKILIDKKGT